MGLAARELAERHRRDAHDFRVFGDVVVAEAVLLSVLVDRPEGA